MKKFSIVLSIAALALAIYGCAPTTPATSDSGSSDSDTGVSGDINGDVTWSKDTYVSDDVDVYGSLTIAPGVTVTLAKDAEIEITTNGTLKAVGTADKMITFKAATASGWSGIYFNAGADNNTLDYCDISGAGSYNYYAIDCSAAGGEKFTISHCVIHDNLKGGIDASYAASGSILSNRFYGNVEFPAVINENITLDATNVFAKSGEATASSTVNCVKFFGDISASKTLTFDITEVPYLNESSIVIYGTLTINAGATIWMGDHAFIDITDTGSLKANGTAAKGIAFAPRRSTDVWNQVYFYDSSDGNTLSYCTFTGGGASTKYVLEFYSTGTGIEATIDHCSIYGNAAGGIYAEYDQNGLVISECTFGNNGDKASGPYDIYYHETGVTVTNPNVISGTNDLNTKLIPAD
jgi:hypothetical protein